MIAELSDHRPETLLTVKPAEYRELAAALERGSGTFTLADGPVRQGTPLASLVVETTDQPGVRIAADRAGRTLRISGPAPKLSVLAQIVRDSAETGDPDGHVHIEYYPEHFYLDESSELLILWDAID